MNSQEVTILISTSPIPAHPDTKFIDKAIEHARFWFPKAPILIMADGIWSKLEYRRRNYLDYLDAIRNRYSNCCVEEFSCHFGQSGMAQIAFSRKLIKTPYILFNEHDIVIDTDKPIDWDSIINMLASKEANVVRLSGFGEGVHPEHVYLTVGGPEQHWNSVFQKTIQWSQWPHVARSDYYEQMLNANFTPAEVNMIEERMHSVLQTHLWQENKVWVYLPDGCDKCRIHHMDARYKEDGTKDPCFWG